MVAHSRSTTPLTSWEFAMHKFAVSVVLVSFLAVSCGEKATPVSSTSSGEVRTAQPEVKNDRKPREPEKAAAAVSEANKALASKDYDRALKSFEEALGFDGDKAQALVGAAKIHLKKKDYDKAAESCTTAMLQEECPCIVPVESERLLER